MYNAFATKREDFHSCEHSICSFFDLIDRVWVGTKVVPFPLHRFCTLMRKMNAKCFLQEGLILNDELLEEKEMAEKYFDSEVGFNAVRLSFFCTSPSYLNWDDSEDKFEKFFLGYAVIVTINNKEDHYSYLIEAIIRPPSIVFLKKDEEPFIEPATNYYTHNIKKFTTVIGTEDFSKKLQIEGSFFSQQNGLTSVCAHAAIRMAINSSPLLNTPKLTNKYINDCLGIKNYNPNGGLSRKQMETVVSGLGYKCHSANFLENTQIEYDQFIYPSLESCFPIILGLQGHNTSHVVSVLGHTINSDRWSPEAKCGYGNYPIQHYISSASWCDHFIISDDNYGMFETLPSDMIRNFIVPTKNPNLHVSMAISILPNEVTLQGYEVEQQARLIADKLISLTELAPPNRWHNRLKNDKLVLRTLLQKKEQYLRFIHSHVKNVTINQQQCFENLSKYVWVTEVSLPNIYTGNKHKLGDVVIHANSSQNELIEGKCLALAWFPGFVKLGNSPDVEVWDIDKHVPLIRNTQDSILEW